MIYDENVFKFKFDIPSFCETTKSNIIMCSLGINECHYLTLILDRLKVLSKSH